MERFFIKIEHLYTKLDWVLCLGDMETDEYQYPKYEYEQYSVLYENKLLANFWVSSQNEMLMQNHIPLDIDTINWIYEQAKIRKFKQELEK